VILLTNVFASGQTVSSNVLEKARVTAATAVASAAEAGMMRDMAVIAVRNAMAAENDANEAFLVAAKAGDKKKLSSARKLLDAISDSALDARANLESIADYVRDAGLAATSALEQEKAVQSAQSQRAAEYSLSKIERYAKCAEKSARRAKEIAEILKKQWLLPVIKANVPAQPGL